MAKLNNEWWNNFRGSFDTEEDVFEFIFDRMDTSDFEDSYIDAAGYGEPNECIKQTALDKRRLLYDFMMQILEEVQQYREIGTLEECRAAVEKQKTKKPLNVSIAKDGTEIVGVVGRCPCCNGIIDDTMIWCDDCGQKLDW